MNKPLLICIMGLVSFGTFALTNNSSMVSKAQRSLLMNKVGAGQSNEGEIIGNFKNQQVNSISYVNVGNPKPRIFVVTNNGEILANDNGGGSWYNYFYRDKLFNGAIPTSVVAVSSTNNIKYPLVYVGTDSGDVWSYASAQEGWTKIYSLGEGKIIQMLSYGEDIYAATKGGYIWKYENKSKSWAKLNSQSLDDSELLSISLDSKGNVYAGTSNGSVWVLYVGSSSFTKVIGLGYEHAVNALVVNSSGYIYAGTKHGYVWKISPEGRLEMVGGKSTDNSSINSIILDQFNDVYVGTENGNIISYQISTRAWNTLSNVDGTKVTTLMKYSLQSGSIKFDMVYAGTQHGNLWNYTATNPLANSNNQIVKLTSSNNVRHPISKSAVLPW